MKKVLGMPASHIGVCGFKFQFKFCPHLLLMCVLKSRWWWWLKQSDCCAHVEDPNWVAGFAFGLTWHSSSSCGLLGMNQQKKAPPLSLSILSCSFLLCFFKKKKMELFCSVWNQKTISLQMKHKQSDQQFWSPPFRIILNMLVAKIQQVFLAII